jgi:DNA-binding CsgD family transcriptional regulator/PAS domain-containing protein
MAGTDDLLATIGAVHAAALDAQLWPRALEAVARTVGGIGASLDTIDRRTHRPREFHAFGMPPAAQLAYFSQYAGINPRWSLITRQKAGEVGWDYRILDQHTMDRSPFYAEFLHRLDFPYFVYGMLTASEQEFAGIAVHRSHKQGHVDRAGIGMMERLLPHVQQAYDVARRLEGAGDNRHSLERALDWLADGVILVRADATVVYANEAFQAMARGGDGIRTRRGTIDIMAADARARFDQALGAVIRLQSGDPARSGVSDFPVSRPSGAPPYLVAVRPLVGREGRARVADSAAVAIVFVRDPLGRNAAAMRLLRDVFGLTESEASLAQALQGGVPLGDYARARALSLNTVYTHLRRIREKTGCKRMAELIRKLNDLQVPLRLD